MKKQEFKNNEERLRNLQDILKRSNIRIIGVPEGEEEEQEMENLFEKIMKENCPDLANEIDFQEVQEAHRIGWVWLQNRGKSEGYEKWIKGKCTGNQQWQEGSRDWNQ